MTRKLFLVLALLAITCTYSSAFDRELGIGVGLGTLGIGLEVATPVAEKLNVRGILSGAAITFSGIDSGNEYDYDLTIHALGAVADYHVFDGGFRLSGGLLINGNGIDMTAKLADGEDYEINDVDYSSDELGAFTGELSFSGLAPYFGIGWGNMVGEDKKLGWMLDLGTMYSGPPTVKLSTEIELPDPVAQAELEADLNEEQTALEDEISMFDTYSVIRLAVTYKIF